ncbi:class II fructose-bisphosphate aldolase [Caproiciproducens faecalis]|uniref:Class II fructose-bisphosphate aldolase n=1 Tax=Caproiciproducens faecalis TaxID=2820301 RepID=A0ABS7DJT1_9FIRM|nr:class II fructose-bisphosphate aldolase [Caproiciproducens faecalis]MBW7571352.1 class II fructose-bisphosphate aldolase [Caproiciproducens faecalis]
MGLVTMDAVLKKAKEGNYAVPAFNVCNLEFIKTVIETAEKMNSPVIVATHPVEIEYAGIDRISSMVQSFARKTHIPIVLHLDHGDTYERAVDCIEHGYTSVMFDGSGFPYEENIKRTQAVVKTAHAQNVSVEAELGLIGGNEGDALTEAGGLSRDNLTNPEQAADFVLKTNVDSLAVAIGSAHGFYKGIPQIDVDRLSQIRNRVSIPLVLHGGSGIPDEIIRDCVKNGISKLNIATELKYAYYLGILKSIKENPDEFDPRSVFAVAMKNAEDLVRQKIELLGSGNKA